MHRMKFFLHVCVIALLLVLQQGAAVHALSHLPGNTQQDDGAPAGSEACAKCLGYAQVGSALHSDAAIVSTVFVTVFLTIVPALLVLAKTHPAYLTRAPPLLV